MAAREDYHSIQMRDVAARAGVSSSSLYQCFPSRNHLMIAVLGHHLSGFTAAIDSDLTGVTDSFARLTIGIDRLVGQMQRFRRTATTLTHAYADAYIESVVEADLVRDRTLDMFERLVTAQPRTDQQQQTAAILTDVWT